MNLSSEILLEVEHLCVEYAIRGRGGRHLRLRAVEDVSFTIKRGKTLGIVGESGSGKSSIARALLRLIPVASGTIRYGEADLLALSGIALREMRRHMQMIFQDPLASLDPRMTVEEIIGEPLLVFQPWQSRPARRETVLAVMERVGLGAEHLTRFPHEFSGGQAQRIGIARALILQPELLVCDEPLSALDVSIKAQISNLLRDLQREMGLTLLFISHDLAAVRYSCDGVLVLYLGRVMEYGRRDLVFTTPRHPYTRALLDAVPIPDPALIHTRRARSLGGEVPSPLDPPSGCVFRTRCPLATELCAREVPQLREVGGVLVACHHAH